MSDRDAREKRQDDLEREMLTLGVERFKEGFRKLFASGKLAETPVGATIIRNNLDALEAELKPVSGKPGPTSWQERYLAHVEPSAQAHAIITGLLNHVQKSESSQSLGEYIARDLETLAQYQDAEVEHDKRTGRLLKGGKYGDQLVRVPYKPLSKEDAQQLGLHALHALARSKETAVAVTRSQLALPAKEQNADPGTSEATETRLTLYRDTRRVKRTSLLSLGKEVRAELDRAPSVYSRPRFLPMVVPPVPWSDLGPNATGGGYRHPILSRHVRMMKHRPVYYLEALQNAPTILQAVKDALNAVQSVAWRINRPVYEAMRGLESTMKWERNRAGKVWDKRRKEWREPPAWRLLSLDFAERFVEDEAIYFPHTLDWRGRMYPVPTGLSHVGSDAEKALLTFAKGKPLEEEAQYEWLLIHGANVGMKGRKVSFGERIKWVKDNEAMILECASRPNETWPQWRKAGDPWQFLAFCFEYKALTDYIAKNGGFNGFVSSLPVGMDGSCNGLQHFAAMMRDEQSGAAVNLVPSDEPRDIYQDVADQVSAAVRAGDYRQWHEGYAARTRLRAMAKGDEPTLRRLEREEKTRDDDARKLRKLAADDLINRKMLKAPVMTYAYGAGNRTRWGQIRDYLRASDETGTALWPRVPHGVCVYLETGKGGGITKHIERAARAASLAMKWLKGVAREMNDLGEPILWRTPAHLMVLQRELKTQSKQEVIVRKGERYRRNYLVPLDPPELDEKEQVKGIAPNFVHSLDAAHLMLTINAARSQEVESFAMVHDCYGTTAADAPKIAMLLRWTFMEMYQEHAPLAELRTRLMEAVEVTLDEPPSLGALDIRAVRGSKYFFA